MPERGLGILTVRHRVVQMAAKLVLESRSRRTSSRSRMGSDPRRVVSHPVAETPQGGGDLVAAVEHLPAELAGPQGDEPCARATAGADPAPDAVTKTCEA